MWPEDDSWTGYSGDDPTQGYSDPYYSPPSQEDLAQYQNQAQPEDQGYGQIMPQEDLNLPVGQWPSQDYTGPSMYGSALSGPQSLNAAGALYTPEDFGSVADRSSGPQSLNAANAPYGEWNGAPAGAAQYGQGTVRSPANTAPEKSWYEKLPLGALVTALLTPAAAALFRPKPERPPIASVGSGGEGGGGDESARAHSSSRPSGIGSARALGGYLNFPAREQQFSGLTGALQNQQNALPEVTQDALLKRSDDLYNSVLAPRLEKDMKLEEARILEMANKLGLNPAGPLQNLYDRYSTQQRAARSQADQQALQYAQALVQTGVARIAPGLNLAQIINPAAYAGSLASVFAAPISESEGAALPPNQTITLG